MKNFSFILFIFIAFACNSSKVDIPSDFSASYSLKNTLIKYELTINIVGNELSLNYKNEQNSSSGNGVYTLKDSEINDLYKYLKSINFASMEALKGDQILDAPQQDVKATYDNKLNIIYFGNVKNPPDNILKVKSMIIDLTSKYHSSFKKDMGLE